MPTHSNHGSDSEESASITSGYSLSTEIREYLPNEFPEREEEMNELATVLQPAANGSSAHNCLVVGGEGQGKTSCLAALLHELRTEYDVTTLHIDCSACVTERDVWVSIADRLQFEQNRFIPETSVKGPGKDVIDEVKKGLSSIGGVIVLVLDDLNHITSANGLLYHLSRMRVEECRFGTICVSRNSELTRDIDDDTRSTWGHRRVTFSKYSTDDLVNILSRRLAISGKEDRVTEDIVKACAEEASEFRNSARAGIEILRSSIASTSDENVTYDDVTQSVDLYSRRKVLQVLDESDLLTASVIMTVVTAESNGDTPNKPKTLYTYYQDIIDETSVRGLTFESFHEELKHAVDLGVLTRNREHDNMRYSCAMPAEIIYHSVQMRNDNIFPSIKFHTP